MRLLLATHPDLHLAHPQVRGRGVRDRSIEVAVVVTAVVPGEPSFPAREGCLGEGVTTGGQARAALSSLTGGSYNSALARGIRRKRLSPDLGETAGRTDPGAEGASGCWSER